MNAAKEKSLSPAGLTALRVVLLLVAALFLPETRVWGFAASPQPASGPIACVSPSSVGVIAPAWAYDASDCLVAAETGGMFRRTANLGEFSDLPVTMNVKTVRQVADSAGIGLDGIKLQIVRDPELIGSNFFGWTRNDGGLIQLYPDAFSSLENLVKTLGHERIHVYQFKTFGAFENTADAALMESAAGGSEASWWQ